MRVAIVGGGISGLATGEAVVRRAAREGRPVEVVVLEAQDAVGGKVQSRSMDGFVVETGPHGFLDREPAVLDLVDRLGLTGDLIRADQTAARRFIVRQGALRKLPESPPEFLGSSVLSPWGRLRVLFEPFAARAPKETEESVWDFAARRIGKEAANVLVDAMVTGIYGGDPKTLSLPSAFPRMRALEAEYGSLIRAQIALAREKKKARRLAQPANASNGSTPAAPRSAPGAPTGTLCSFRGGLGSLTASLGSRLAVRTGHPVAHIECPRGTEGGFTLVGGPEPVEADRVFLAVPAFDAEALVGPLAPTAAESLGAVPYAAISVAVFGFRRSDIERPLDGFGYLAPHGEGRLALGTIWASSVFPEHVPEGAVMFRSMVGGARRPAVAELPRDDLLAIVREELERFCGVPNTAEPLFQDVIRWPRGIPQYTLGHAARAEAARAVTDEVPGLVVGGNGFFGVALLDCVCEAETWADRLLA